MLHARTRLRRMSTSLFIGNAGTGSRSLAQISPAGVSHVDVGTLRNWEQGRREPTGPAKALLTAISRDPTNVLKALATA